MLHAPDFPSPARGRPLSESHGHGRSDTDIALKDRCARIEPAMTVKSLPMTQQGSLSAITWQDRKGAGRTVLETGPIAPVWFGHLQCHLLPAGTTKLPCQSVKAAQQ